MAIVTLAQAKAHLRITASGDDADITLKLAQAEAIVMDYIKQADYEGAASVVQAAILLQLGELYRFRGDDETPPPQTTGDLSPVVTNLLRRLRDPSLA